MSDVVVKNSYIPIVDFLKGSKTKYLKFVMQNFRGEEINTQVIRAEDLDYSGDCVTAKYKINDELSAIMVPEQYRLFIYLIDEEPADPESSSEPTIIYNKCLTENGIQIRVK